MYSESAFPFLADGLFIVIISQFLTLVVAHKSVDCLKILAICDEAITVLINRIENIVCYLLGDSHTQEGICFIDQGKEFVKSDLSLLFVLDPSFFVLLLKNELTTVSLEEIVSLYKIYITS